MLRVGSAWARQATRRTTNAPNDANILPAAIPTAITRCALLLIVVPMLAFETPAWSRAEGSPFETGHPFKVANKIDTLVLAGLKKHGLEPANLCPDEVFVRRVFLDVIGTLPTGPEVRAFLKDKRPDKRAKLIDALLKRPEYADYGSLKWCDLLRVKAEYPIKLWPNAVQVYHRWVHDSLAKDKPYNQFARELLTSSGSNFRMPPVNFYRAIQGRSTEAIARAAALTLMGVRLGKWSEDRRAGIEAFFSKVAYKKTAEWKEEIVYLDPAPSGPVDAVFPDGTPVRIESSQDPRGVFADWLLEPNNPWFAKNAVNRIWAWLLGRGIIHEPDDIRPDNPPTYPKLLAYLETELVAADYDLKHIYRLILNSSIYQQSCIPRCDATTAAEHFACYPVRQLDAEVLIDAICQITGTRERYSSPIPEPYTFVPETHRTIMLPDGSISSQFLEIFGRPARDTGLWSERQNHPTDAQRLHLLNSTHIRNKIANSWRLRELIRANRRNRRAQIETLYLNVLSRHPTRDEFVAAKRYFKDSDLNQRQAFEDLLWALINTKEFLCRH